MLFNKDVVEINGVHVTVATRCLQPNDAVFVGHQQLGCVTEFPSRDNTKCVMRYVRCCSKASITLIQLQFISLPSNPYPISTVRSKKHALVIIPCILTVS